MLQVFYVPVQDPIVVFAKQEKIIVCGTGVIIESSSSLDGAISKLRAEAGKSACFDLF